MFWYFAVVSTPEGMRCFLVSLFTTISLSSYCQSVFEAFPLTRLDNYNFNEMAFGDYDGDGDIDFAGTSTFGADNGLGTVLMKNNGGKNFSSVYGPFINGNDVAWLDVDNDNDLDLFVVGCYYNCATALYVNKGNDIFAEVFTGLPGASGISTSDFNSDGKIDLVLSSGTDFFFYKNKGSYIFEALPSTYVEYSADLAWADFNNDGYPDFAAGRKLYQNNQDNTFTPIDLGFVNNGSSTYLWADLDNDNDFDFVRHANSYIYTPNQTTYSNTIKVYENQGANVFVDRGILSGVVGMNTRPLSADFDNDGDMDFLINGTLTSNQYSESVTKIFRNDGNFSFTGELVNSNLIYSYNFHVADIDNDRDADIMLGSSFGEYRGLENITSTNATQPVAPTLSPASITADNLTLTWSAGSDQESPRLLYNLYVKRDDVFFVTPQSDITKGWPMVPGYANMAMQLEKSIDISQWPEGRYTWGVQAIDHEPNASPFSAEGSFEIRRNVPANTPAALTITSLASSSVTLNWTDLSSDELSFDIERSSDESNAGFEVIESIPENAVSYIDNSVEPGSHYFYRVRITGSNTTSNIVEAQVPTSLPVSPSNLITTQTFPTRISFTWEYIPTDNTGFVIERSTSNLRDFNPVATVSASARAFTDTELSTGTTYFYRVFAKATDGRSQSSDVLKASTTEQLIVKKELPSYLYEFNGMSISWADYNNDGYDDAFIPYKSQLLKNNGDGTFSKIENHGIKLETESTYSICVWGDYDNDGYVDIFVGSDNGISNWIFRNNGDGTFRRIVSRVTLDVPAIRSASWADVDNDGDLELMVCGDYYRAYLRYDGGDVFTKVDLPKSANQTGFKFTAWGDVNDDGYTDAYFGIGGRDQIMLNERGVFTPVSSPLLASSDYGSLFAIWSDFNNDLKLDLTSLNDDNDYLFASGPSGYEVKMSFTAYPSSPGGNTSWVDFDNDGDLDLYSWAGYTTWVYENTGSGNFKRKISSPLNDVIRDFNAISWVDYNNDGFIDGMPLGTNTNIFENTPNGNAWVRLRLKGKQSNSKGVGAKIFLKSGGKWQRRDIHTGHSWQVQEGFDVIVGLGAATLVDSIKVKWPSGAIQYLVDQEIKTIVVINEADAQVKSFGNPSNLRSRPVSLSSLSLVWQDNSSDEESFVVQKSPDGLVFNDLISLPASTTSVTINDLSMNIDYTFRVVARKAGTISEPTNTVIGKIDLFQEVNGGYFSRADFETTGASWMDIGLDGKPDLFLGGRSFDGDAIFTNTGEEFFTREPLVPDPTGFNLTRSGTWGDYNNDGFSDLFLSVGGGSSTVEEHLNDQLWKNVNGVLTKQSMNVITKDGKSTWHAAWGDLNKDGYLDLVAGNGNHIAAYFSNAGESFRLSNIIGNPEVSRLVLSDIDNDNDLDLVSGSFKLLNFEGGTFSAPSGSPVFGNFVVADLDEDGSVEVLLAGTGITYFKYNNSIKQFEAQPNLFPGMPASAYTDVNVADFDNNGHLDVIAVRNGKPELYLNEGKMSFTKFDSPVLSSLQVGSGSSAIADFNNDATPDIFFVAGQYARKVLVKSSRTENHWLRIKLKGIQSPRDGIGAKIKLFQKHAFQMREIHSSQGSFSANEQIAHFGLGASTFIDYLKIEWPSGNSQWIKNPTVDKLMLIEEANTPGPEIPAPSNLTASLAGDDKIALTWNDPWDFEHGFVIERSIGDQFDFMPIATVPPNTVTFDDRGQFGGASVHYRIKTFFDNRSFEPSNVATVVITSIESRNNGIAVYPNPASEYIFVTSETSLESVQLLDSRGRRIHQEAVQPNVKEYKVDLHPFETGIYLLRIKTANAIVTHKLVVSH